MRKTYRLVAIGATAIAMGCATPVFAANPLDIPPGIFVVDEADVLTDSEEKALNSRIKQLEVEDGHALYVVYVDTFTNPADPQKWLGDTADKAGLLSTDSMLAIAVESRKAQFESHSSGKIAKYDSDIFTDEIRPALAEGQWGEAGIAAADGISKAKAGYYSESEVTHLGADEISSMFIESNKPKEPTNFAPFLIGTGGLLGAGGLFVGGLAMTRSMKRRRLQAAQAAQLKTEADTAQSTAARQIIRASELAPEGENLLGFIQAEHGDIVAEHVRLTFAQGQKALAKAFELQSDLNEGGHEDRVRLDLWKSAGKHATTAVSKFESLEAVAEEFTKNIDQAQDQAKALGRSLASSRRKAISIAGHQLGRTERDTSNRRSAVAKAARLVDSLHSLSQEASSVINSAEGLKTLLQAQSECQQAEAELLEAQKLIGAHFDAVQRLQDYEKNLVSAARQASKFNKLRHPNIAAIASEYLEVAKRSSAAEADADDMHRQLEKLARPLINAVREATEVEHEVAKARKNLQDALRTAENNVIRAESYIRSNSEARHRRSALSSVTGMIEAAKASAQGEDVRASYTMAKNAAATAEKILRQAKSDVDDAERARRAARSRQHSSSSSFSSSNFGSFSFGSSSFSSGFGSGGAGGSFGDSGGAGGSF